MSHSYISSWNHCRYGLTETCATGTKTIPGDANAGGTTGPPQPVNEVKLIDVPEMKYSTDDKPNPRGELLMRGCNTFTIYYKGGFIGPILPSHRHLHRY
jgi:long-subunit acyl-CoA synthetase (AMP-forming)